MKKYTVAKYLRISLEDNEIGESQSIINQRSLLNDFLSTKQEFYNAEQEEYIDDGYTGTNLERPALETLLKKANCGDIQCIIVKDLSRFARNHIEQGRYLEMVFPLMGVRFISINDNYDSDDVLKRTNDIGIPIKGVIYELYSKDLSAKVKSVKKELGREGKVCGGLTPYGYLKDPEEKFPYIIDYESSEVVKRIFDMSLEGMGAGAIAKELNSENIPSPGGYKMKHGEHSYGNNRTVTNIWDSTIVRKILEDERYTGKLILGKRERIGIGVNRAVLLPEEKWFCFEDAYEAIINKDIFKRVCALRQHCTSKSKRECVNHILYRKVKCPICGRYMHHKINKHRNTFFCKTPKLLNGTNCFTGHISEQSIFDAVFKVLEISIQLSNDYFKEADTIKRKGGQNNTKRQNTNKNEKKIEEVLPQKCLLYEKYRQNILTREEYLLQKNSYKCKEDNLDYKNMVNDISEFRSGNHNNTYSILKNDNALTKNIVESFVDMIYAYDNNNIKIKLRFENSLGV